jgi:hypothetical protein
MEPAIERREYAASQVDYQCVFILPQWSPSLSGGSIRAHRDAQLGPHDAAMEPAIERREHGAQFRGRLSCTDRASREQQVEAWRSILPKWTCQGTKRPLTCMRALFGFRLTTSALALRR